ncbi:MAG: helix-turn-helix domain-containing protein [Deltaproteobacteria bacterium]|nr:helix-turn-helix domain-containing protein [Deltaproteobacteria bacterium]
MKMRIVYSEVIERMRWVGKHKNNSSVARVLGVTPQALSNYKKKDKMPVSIVLKYSKLYGLSLDWLITGKGEIFNARPMAAGEAYEAAPGSVRMDLNSLSTDEMVYTTKLLRIFRGSDTPLLNSMKYLLNSLSKREAE